MDVLSDVRVLVNILLVVILGSLLFTVESSIMILVILASLAGTNILFLWRQNTAHLKDIASINKQHHHQQAQTEQRRVMVQERFQSFIDSLENAVLRINAKGKIRMFNKKASDIFKRDPLANLHFDVLKSISKSLHETIQKGFLTQTRQDLNVQLEGRIYSLSVSPLFIATRFNGMMVILYDITEIKNAEMFQKQFTADVTHELRNPLSSIRGFSEIISRETMDNLDEIKKFSALIQSEAMRLEQLISDLLMIAKMDRIDYQLDIKPTNIKVLANNVAEVLRPKTEAKALSFECTMDDAELPIDEEKITQALFNLIQNAINYTDKGSISLTGVNKQNGYEIRISDTGIGIPEEEQDNIFKRFYRIEAARSRDTGGSGLGLSIVKNTVRKHNGSIQLDAKENLGTTITIELPHTRY